MSAPNSLPPVPPEEASAEEAPYDLVPAGPQLRTVAWRQVVYLVLIVAVTLLPLGIALALAV